MVAGLMSSLKCEVGLLDDKDNSHLAKGIPSLTPEIIALTKIFSLEYQSG